MPCDSIFITTPMALGNLDRGILARALDADGWRVTQESGHLSATKGRNRLDVVADGATLYASEWANRERLTAKILQSYGRIAATETASKFGFALQSTTVENGGAVKLTFARNLGPSLAGPQLGKVGL